MSRTSTAAALCFAALIASTVLLSHNAGAIDMHAIKAAPIPDGDACLVCVVVSLLAQTLRPRNAQELISMEPEICNNLPNNEASCKFLVSNHAQAIIDHMANPADELCGPTGPYPVCDQCKIDPSANMQNSVNRDRQSRARLVAELLRLRTKTQNKVSYEPTIDLDADFHSPNRGGLRGVDWRGRDCNDRDSNTRPGVYDEARFPNIDRNCNGISGADSRGVSYESQFCDTTRTVSLVTLGDSASAGFRIPEQWLDPENCGDWCFMDTIKQGALNELDWPHKSAMTGFEEPNGNSLISYLTKHNRCNHRDYQNVARNGAEWDDFMTQNEKFIVTPSSKPIILVVAYIGNDVCKRSLADMTTVEELLPYLENGFTFLNTKLPAGSKVLVNGLVDGRFLWNTLYDKTHPLGVSYEKLYNFLTCTNANPCNTWLSSDEAVRNATTDRAMELSAAIRDYIAENARRFNFELVYEDFPLDEMIRRANARGISDQMLIEPIDGFHPSLVYGHPILAEYTWEIINRKWPNWIGEPNRNNEAIQQLFGDQGGY
eukprot:TRINITY_DN2460_c0_g2_i1.p1 TRINITY_DN2460_c0_g2~~TRINITY_DN2460_c0_g2_i1.p1  ORF type:complete len:545 (+),score=119.79 TRINITY_DN2460_c0_g2_i1:54-1688(+)